MKKLLTSILLWIPIVLLQAQNWQTDLQQSQQMASPENKKIILVFQGSDWCAPCMKLEKEIWNSETFISYAKEHYVLLKADFPRRKKNKLSEEQQEKNNRLAEKYNPHGFFPLVVVLDADAMVLGNLGYEKKSPKEYIEKINSFH